MTVKKARWKIVLYVASAVALLTVGYYGLSRYLEARFEKRWQSVQVGMSKEEVRAILGGPQNSYGPGQGGFIANLLFDTRLEKWAYGHRREFTFQKEFPFVTLALEALLFPKPDDHVLYFSRDAKVVKKVYPYRRTRPENRRGEP